MKLTHACFEAVCTVISKVLRPVKRECTLFPYKNSSIRLIFNTTAHFSDATSLVLKPYTGKDVSIVSSSAATVDVSFIRILE